MKLWFILGFAATSAFTQEPWGWESNGIFPDTPPGPYESADHSGDAPVYERLLKFYKSSISPKQAIACPCYPSCSTYTLYAMRHYGFWSGFLMGMDRLYFRETRDLLERRAYESITVNGTIKIYDIPEANRPWVDKDWRMVNPFFRLRTSGL